MKQKVIDTLTPHANVVKLFNYENEEINGPEKLIQFPDRHGTQYLKASTILYLNSDSNYTYVHFIDGRKLLLSRTMKNVFGFLPITQFIRIHNSYVINIDQIICIRRNTITITGNIDCPLSRSFDKTRLL